METVITVKNLNKEFKVKRKIEGFKGALKSLFKPELEKVKAINNISFNVGRGEILAFIGPNGAGKSTTIKVLTGILYPTSGQASVLGLTPWTKRQNLAFKIGSVFGQRPQLWYHLPPKDTFNLFAKIYEVDDFTYKKRLSFLVEAFGVAPYMDISVRKLSLGQRMRCEIVASLIHQPEILFLDEPTIGLDIIAKQTIRDILQQINKDHKTTIFLTSHDVSDIEAICERTVIINYGQIIFDGPTESLRKKYFTNKVVKVDFENPIKDLNLVSGKVLNQTKYSLTLELDPKKEKINHFLANLMKKHKVVDLNVNETPLEEIISSIYKEERKKDDSDNG